MVTVAISQNRIGKPFARYGDGGDGCFGVSRLNKKSFLRVRSPKIFFN
jgi:hypothetical protein